MPAKKIIEAVGSTCAVIGSSIATATAGPDAGQHADGGAERAADEGPQQVDRRGRGGEALQQLASKMSITLLRASRCR